MMKTIDMQKIESLQKELSEASAPEVLAAAASLLKRPVFASSFGMEDQVLLDLIVQGGLDIPVFTLDTGRLFPETYDLIALTEKRYGVKVEIAFPDAAEVEQMVAEEGINLFRKSVDLRKRCCGVRKVHPLRKRLRHADGWICGLRREQSPTRTALHAVEWDDANNLPKFNPLARWTLEDVRAYLKEHAVPYNPLHDEGFLSIGCACCTRAVQLGEDERAGRWWWENAEQKECGLHLKKDSYKGSGI